MMFPWWKKMFFMANISEKKIFKKNKQKTLFVWGVIHYAAQCASEVC